MPGLFDDLLAAPPPAPAAAPAGLFDDIIGAPEQPGSIEDAAKAGGSAIIRAVPAIAGVPGDLIKTAGGGIQWLAEKVARKVYGDEQVDRVKAERAKNPPLADRAVDAIPTSGDIMKLARQYAPGADYDPKTTAGEYARTVGEFLPLAAAGPEAIVPKLLKYGVGAGLASEGAGQATEGTKYEPYARAAGAIAGGVAPSAAAAVLPGSRTVENLVRDAMQGMTREQINDAARIMQTAQTQGIRLTWPEALAQATGGQSTGMTTLQRVAEADMHGKPVLGPMMAARPQEVEGAVQGVLGGIAPAPANVSQVGPALARTATDEIDAVRRGINDETRPLYDAARADRIDAGTMAGLVQLPGWDDALRQVRADPQLNRFVAGLPDNNVLVVDAVKQRLSEAAENAAQPLNPQASQTRASGMRQDAGDLQRAATSASGTLEDALTQQARLRAERLTPLQEGQLGNIARADTTRGATEALLPSQPLPGAAAETGRTTAQLAARNPELTAQAIRTRLEDQFSQSAKDLQAGENQFGGAAFRKAAYGTEALRENVQAAVRELPNGAQIGRGLDELMETLAATGRRERPGSLTAPNQVVRDELKGGSTVGEALTSLGKPAEALGWLKDRYQRWALGQNMGDLARLISDPASRDRLIELARLPSNAPQRAQLQAALLAKILQDGQQDDEGRQPSKALLDAMMKKGN